MLLSLRATPHSVLFSLRLSESWILLLRQPVLCSMRVYILQPEAVLRSLRATPRSMRVSPAALPSALVSLRQSERGLGRTKACIGRIVVSIND